MSDSEGRERNEHARVPSSETAARRWEQSTIIGMLGYIQSLVRELDVMVRRISDNQDHLHSDLVAIREALRIPRPECYPDVDRKRQARRVRRTPPAPEPPPPAVE